MLSKIDCQRMRGVEEAHVVQEGAMVCVRASGSLVPPKCALARIA